MEKNGLISILKANSPLHIKKNLLTFKYHLCVIIIKEILL